MFRVRKILQLEQCRRVNQPSTKKKSRNDEKKRHTKKSGISGERFHNCACSTQKELKY